MLSRKVFWIISVVLFGAIFPFKSQNCPFWWRWNTMSVAKNVKVVNEAGQS